MITHVKALYNSIDSGGTREQLTTTSTLVQWAIFQCTSGTEIWIGDENVSATTAGFGIAVGDPPLTIPPHQTDPIQPFDLSHIWVDGTTSDVVRCIYMEE